MEDIILENYRYLVNYLNLSPAESNIFHVLALVVLIVFFAVFIWYFGQSLSQRDLLKLNLRQYNQLEHKGWRKFLAIIFYLIEYLIVMPFIIFLWFAGLAIFILLIADGRAINEVLMISAALVASVRILSYFNKELSSDLAQYFPFITLSVFLLSASAFNLEKIMAQLVEIPLLLNNILFSLIAVFIIEFILRIFHTIWIFWQSEDGVEDIYTN